MNPSNPRRIRRAAEVLLAGSVLAAALLASSAATAAAAGFDSRMSALVAQVKNDPNYKRIPLDSTPDREWFYSQSEAVYTGKMSKDQFVSEGAKHFPGYEASLATVADFMTAK